MRGIGEVVDSVDEGVCKRCGNGSAQEQQPHSLGDAPAGVLDALHGLVGLVNQLVVFLPRPLQIPGDPVKCLLRTAE